MKLFATRSTPSKSWEVYDDNGTAYIVRKLRSGKIDCAWHAIGRTAEQWVEIQRNRDSFVRA